MRAISQSLFLVLTLILGHSNTTSEAVEPERQVIRQSAPSQTNQDRTILLPSDDRHTLWIAGDYQHLGKTVDVLFDFHGYPPRVRTSTRMARLNCVVISVQYSGLSSVYRTPFSENRQLFATILNEALKAIQAEPDFPDDVQWGRLAISSFSAGFGAVREVLKSQDYYNRIAGIYMVDSLYCGYVGDGTGSIQEGIVHPDLMKDFLRFAQAAAAGEKVMIITHCMEPTPGYASTSETADYLLDQLELEPQPIDITVELPAQAKGTAGKLRLYRKAIRKGFSLYGSTGLGATDHVEHLRNMAYWLPELPWSKSHPTTCTTIRDDQTE